MEIKGAIKISEKESARLMLCHRGRTASYPAAPAQIPACGFSAPGSSEILASAIQPKPSKFPTLSGACPRFGDVSLESAVAPL